MTRACAEPVAWSRLVDYWVGDLEAAESDRIEEHLFCCPACSAELARVARVAQVLRTAIPAVLGADQLQELRERGLTIEENPVASGSRREVEFRPGVDLLIHRLQGMDLAGARRVQVTVRSESTGEVFFEDHFAPFDPARGEVLIACQRHFASLPADVVFDVQAHVEDGSGRVSRASFFVPHVFSA